MELLQLKYFLEVAHSQHMTRSAEKLHIAQPSLSQSIHRLEDELGVKLFAARGRNIILTEQGTFLRDRLEPILDKLDALPEQLRENESSQNTLIRLHVTAASLIVSEAIIEYKKTHEHTSFQFLSSEDSNLFDVSIGVNLEENLVDANSESRFTCGEKIYLAVPDIEKYRDMKTVKLKDFRDADFINLIAQKRFRVICDRLCASAGFRPRVAFESDNPETVRNMIAANIGVGFWPAFSWGKFKQDKMRLLSVSEPKCRRDITIEMRKNRVDASAVVEFFGFLTDFFTARMLESREQ